MACWPANRALLTVYVRKHDLKELKPYGFDVSTPLWYYTLKEAELLADALSLLMAAAFVGKYYRCSSAVGGP